MALKNRDLVFVIKVQNQAKAALTGLRADLRGVGTSAQAGVKGLNAQTAALEALRKKAIETQKALDALNRGGGRSARSTSGATGGNSKGGASANTDLSALARSAKAAATQLERLARARGTGGGTGGGSPGPARGGNADFTRLIRSANEAATALTRVTRNSTSNATSVQRMATAARTAATALNRIRAQAGRGANPNAQATITVASLRSLSTSARAAATALDRIARARPSPAPRGGAGAGAGAAAGSRLGLGTIIGGAAIAGAIAGYAKLSDEYKNLYARVSLTTKGVQDQESTFSRIVGVANGTRQSLEGTVTTYYRMAQAGKNLGLSQDKVFRATELVSKAVTISGASAEAAKGALIQLGQGLGSGTLRGEELNSVLEQTPRLAEALTKGLGFKSVSALRAFAMAGKLTSESVIKALLSQGAALDKEFSQFPVTIGQAFTVLQNNAAVAVGEIEKSTGTTANFAQAILKIGLLLGDPAVRAQLMSLIQTIGVVVQGLVTAITGAVNVIITVMPVIKAALAAFAGYWLLVRANALVTGLSIRATLTSIGARAVAAGVSIRTSFITAFSSAAGAARAAGTIIRTSLNVAVGAIGALITAMLLFSDTTVGAGEEQTTFGDILSETFSRLIGWVEDAASIFMSFLDTVGTVFGGTSEAGDKSSSDLTKFFTGAVNIIIASFLTLGQTVGIILGQIMSKVALAGIAMKRFVTGDFAGAAEAANQSSKITVLATAQKVAENARKNFNTDYAGDILKGAAKRTRNAKQTPTGGIAEDSTGTDPKAPGKKGKKSDGEKAAEKQAKLLQKENLELTEQENLIGMVGIAREKYAAVQELSNKFTEAGLSLNRDDVKAILARKSALVDAQRIDAIGQDIYKQATEALQTYNDTVAAGNLLLKKNPELQAAVTKATNLAKEALENYLDPLREMKQQTEDLIAISKLRVDQMAVETKVQEALNAAVQRGDLSREDVTSNTPKAQAVASEARGQARQQAGAQATIDLKGTIDDLNREIALAGVLESKRENVTKLMEYEATLRKAGITDEAQRLSYITQYAEKLQELADAQKAASRDVMAGVREGLESLTQQWTDLRTQAKTFTTEVFGDLNSRLKNFFETGKFGIKGFLRGIGKSLISVGVDGLTGALSGALGGLVGGGGGEGGGGGIGGALGGLLGGGGGASGSNGGAFLSGFTGKATSIMDTYLQANKAIPVAVQNMGAMGGGPMSQQQLMIQGGQQVNGLMMSLIGGGGMGGMMGGGGMMGMMGGGGGGGGGGLGAAISSIAGLFGGGKKNSGGGQQLTGSAVGSLSGAGSDNQFKDVAMDFKSDLSGKLDGITDAAGEAGGGFAQGLGGALQGIISAIGGGGGGGGIGSLIGAAASIIPMLFANGGIMTEHGQVPLRKYSGGGIANSPQLAMFGEGSVPEAYVPVPSGRIPVEMKGGGGGGQIINMNVHAADANSFRKSRGQIASEMAGELSRAGRRNG